MTEAIWLGQMNRRLAMGLLGRRCCGQRQRGVGLWAHPIQPRDAVCFIGVDAVLYRHQTLAVWLLRARIIPSVSATPNYDGELLWQRRYTFVCASPPPRCWGAAL